MRVLYDGITDKADTHFGRDIIIHRRLLREAHDDIGLEIHLSENIFAPIKDGFAVIGRTDKFISPKTVEYVCDEKIKLTEDGPFAYVKGGKLILEE